MDQLGFDSTNRYGGKEVHDAETRHAKKVDLTSLHGAFPLVCVLHTIPYVDLVSNPKLLHIYFLGRLKYRLLYKDSRMLMLSMDCV